LRILSRDRKHGLVKLLVQNLDDLWALYNLVEPEDLVGARSTREVKVEGVGRPSSRRKPISLTLRVEKVQFDKATSRVRLLGTVVEAPEDFHIQGSHHAVSVAPGNQLVVRKERWQKHQLERLQRAVIREPPITVVALDMEEAAVATVRSFGIEVKAIIRSRLPGKNEPSKREQAAAKYYSEILGLLSTMRGKDESKIVIVGPGFAKDSLTRHIKERSKHVAGRVAAVYGVSSAGEAGVHEAIRRGLLSKVYRYARIGEEVALVEEVLKRIGLSRGDVSFGLDEVIDDTSSGAVERILVADQTIREADEQSRERLDQTLRSVERMGGRVSVISTEHEGGRKLRSLGGVAALLRYRRHV